MAVNLVLPYEIGMTYGQGFDSLTGFIRGFGIAHQVPETLPNAGGQTIRYFLNKTEDESELKKQLGLSAEVHAQFGLFGASAKVEFAESSSFNSYSVFLVARVQVQNAFSQLVDAALDDAAKAVYTDQGKERFYEEFGDSYVTGLQTGGEFCAVLELRTTTSEDQRSLSASLSGSYGFAADAEVSFAQKMHEVTQHRFLKISMFQAGGNETSVTNSVDEVLAKVKNYAAAVKGAPVAYQALIVDDRTLDMPRDPNPIELQTAKDVLLQYARQREALLAVLNDISYVRENPEEFVNPDIGKLNEAAADCAARLNRLKDNASVAAQSPQQARYDDVGMPVITLPPRVAVQPETRLMSSVWSGSGHSQSRRSGRSRARPGRPTRPGPTRSTKPEPQASSPPKSSTSSSTALPTSSSTAQMFCRAGGSGYTTRTPAPAP
jgi:hypothetical protein